MLDYFTLKIIWWVLVGVLLIGFAIMDGHDMGVGTLLPFVGRNDMERRVVINTVGPHWDGNQVWFITAGGALFAAWPVVYATAFSGFYWAMILVLWALFFRPVGFDYRSKIHNSTWRSTWDWGLFVGGAVPPLVFGIAFGNLLQGVPFHFNDLLVSTYTGSFWQLLNPFALLTGVVSSAMITLQGGAYLAHRTEGVIQARAIKGGVGAAIVLVCSFIVAGIWLQWIDGYRITSVVDTAGLPDILSKSVVREAGAWMANYGHYPLLWLLPALGLIGAAGAAVLLMARHTLSAFIASSLSVIGVICTAGVSMFPFVMPSSTMPAASLTVWDSVASHLSLAIMFWAALIFMPLIVLYTSWAYRVMRGKVTVAQIKANEHSAY
ncbi:MULTISPECIES: cytochrome d ubiquinol oxidase subunit II [Pseudomonas]|jgi:cytochrome d ubiquinol oxidase subunit II|uniref:Cytochrome d ubiquinol oxidase, subunit II n=1 Tax=Pseudomonas mandelii JR-1 TaxID=1147786 RepID=A0A024E540_9PSED|nr:MULTISPECIES: cytochrome d ubiquinol oxidase subunit II [Pseudomonas]MDF9881645.1 cytochrome d ubiquinol oxidase subunit II [Pseudomonas silensiensis]AHZ68059.1 cytochrome d ubiquinol oxidase, subunit II [Pseudomonas mandelii JR-1]MDI1330489.1 cytochrome d ubiquinol oxidase subunit II [Pseudomonas sp.]MDO9327122.1 cytochrome d ubiquinol oxidase subunit II [Pseudomonas sp.]OYQ26450.1 cytochrome d ubiquinol oxidase subunit II [Pseudomonas mandelii]